MCQCFVHYAKNLKAYLGLDREDCQPDVTDEFLCMVVGCALGTDVCHWMFKTSQHGSRSTRFPFKQPSQVEEGAGFHWGELNLSITYTQMVHLLPHSYLLSESYVHDL